MAVGNSSRMLLHGNLDKKIDAKNQNQNLNIVNAWYTALNVKVSLHV